MGKRLVYLDNAATTPVRPEVLEAMLPYLGTEAFGNQSSAHRVARAARAGIVEARRQVAEALAAEPNQVSFTSGGTEADNLAILGAALAARDQGGPIRVAVAGTEHKAVLAAAHALAQYHLDRLFQLDRLRNRRRRCRNRAGRSRRLIRHRRNNRQYRECQNRD